MQHGTIHRHQNRGAFKASQNWFLRRLFLSSFICFLFRNTLHCGCGNLKHGGGSGQIEDVLDSEAFPDDSHDRGGNDRHDVVDTQTDGESPSDLAAVEGDGAHHKGMHYVELLKQDTEDVGRKYEKELGAAFGKGAIGQHSGHQP